MARDTQTRHLKRALRRSVITSILGLDPIVRTAEEDVLRKRFTELPGYASAETVLLYVKAFPEELDTRSFFADALATDKRVLCPRVERAEHRLRLYRIRSLDTDLEPGILGIPEPKLTCPEVKPTTVDWALIPGLAFDRGCFRLGRGGGHYDRLLPRMRPDCLRWSLGFDCQLVDHLPVEAHDAPVDGVAFPRQVIQRG